MSQGVKIIANGDGAWQDMADGRKIRFEEKGSMLQITMLAGGCESGAPSVGIRIDLDDGSTVFAEMTGQMWWSIGCALRGKFPEWIDRPGT